MYKNHNTTKYLIKIDHLFHKNLNTFDFLLEFSIKIQNYIIKTDFLCF